MERPTDPLTGLPPRREMDDELERRIAAREPFAVAMIDVDGFMEVNTELGAEQGDWVLQRLAALIRDEGPGTAYRISGDEFALVMPQATLEQAFLEVEKLRARIAEDTAGFALPGGRGVTVTAGVAHHPRDAKEAQALMGAADAALLSAKENGRNQVALPPNEEMVLKSCYYPAAGLRKLRALAERVGQRESYLLREALNDLLRKYDVARPV